MRKIGKPHNAFKGAKFMTPTVLAYYKLRKGSKLEALEYIESMSDQG